MKGQVFCRKGTPLTMWTWKMETEFFIIRSFGKRRWKAKNPLTFSNYKKQHLRTLPLYSWKEIHQASAGRVSNKSLGLRKRHCEQRNLWRAPVWSQNLTWIPDKVNYPQEVFGQLVLDFIRMKWTGKLFGEQQKELWNRSARNDKMRKTDVCWRRDRWAVFGSFVNLWNLPKPE